MLQQARSERSRRQILDAALKLFSTQGFRATSTREIAEAARISTGALYHQFPDKEMIFQGLLQEYWDAIASPKFPFNQALFSGAFPDDLVALGHAARESVKQYRRYIALIYVDVVEFEGSHIRRFYKEMASRFQAFLDEFPDVKKKLRPEVSPLTRQPVTAVLLFGRIRLQRSQSLRPGRRDGAARDCRDPRARDSWEPACRVVIACARQMLVNCVAYQDGKKLADMGVSEIHVYTSRPNCFVWLALKDPEPSELSELQREFGLHELAVEDARTGHQRPKIEEYGSSLFVVLHTIELEGEELLAGEVAIFAGRDYVISVRRGTRQGFGDVRRRCEEEPDLLRHGPAYVLYALMDAVVDRYFPVLDGLSDHIEQIEERIFAGQTTRANIESLYGLKRKLMRLEHAGTPLLEVTGKLHGGRVPPTCLLLQDYFRDVHDHLVRLKQSIDTLRDMVTTAISVNLSLITMHENEVLKRLAAYASLVAVPTLIAGIYGMNFDYMPELQMTWGYPLALASMVIIDLYLVYRFKKADWF